MSLTAGTRLGPNEIQFQLGAGGMGEVYKARDARLDRTVAILAFFGPHTPYSDRAAKEPRHQLVLEHVRGVVAVAGVARRLDVG